MHALMSQPSAPALPSPPPPSDGAAAASHAAVLADFQRQMAGDGHGVDLDRLQQDRAYARGCLALARGSTSPGLQSAADTIGRLLRVTVPMA